jgi:sulfonate transport system ATP-binding protein
MARVTIDIAEKTFPGADLPVLSDIRLDIEDRSFVAVIGPSGCGKSTLLRCLAGLDSDFDGTVGIEEHSGEHGRVGFVFQRPTLLPWLDVRQNILSGTGGFRRYAALDERIDELLAATQLGSVADYYPDQLSGGMQQRVALARALVSEPSLLLLDEPFSALDAFTRVRMQRHLQSLWASEGKVTAVIVTHDIDEAISVAQRIIVMDRNPGRIRADLRVPLEYPRATASEEFGAFRRAVLGEFEQIFEDAAP